MIHLPAVLLRSFTGLAVAFVGLSTAAFADAWPKAPAPLPSGPFSASLVTSNFDNGADFAFDGLGNIYSRKKEALIRIHSRDINTPAVTMFKGPNGEDIGLWGHPEKYLRIVLDTSPQCDGIRIRADGDLVQAVAVSRPAKKAMGLSVRSPASPLVKRGGPVVPYRGPSGVYTDRANNIWYAGLAYANPETGSPKPSLNFVDAENKHTVILEGDPLDKPWGVAYDSHRKFLYFVEMGQNKLKRIATEGKSTSGKVEEVASVSTPIKGLTLDQYGNAYLIGEIVYRVTFDEQGSAVGAPTALNDKPILHASSGMFGHGEGWDRQALYVISAPAGGGPRGHTAPHNHPLNASHIWKLELGVEGDPEGQMDPSKFKPIDEQARREYFAKAVPHFEEQWGNLEATIKSKAAVDAARDGNSPEMSPLKKIGATADRDPFNAEGRIVFGTGKLTGREPELAALKNIPVMTSIKADGNKELKDFSAFNDATWCGRFFFNDLPYFDDRALKALAASNAKLGFLQIENTPVTADGIVAAFRQESQGRGKKKSLAADTLAFLFVSDFGDEDLRKLIPLFNFRILSINNTGSQKKLSLETLKQLVAMTGLSNLKIKGVDFSDAEVGELKRLMPKVSFAVTAN